MPPRRAIALLPVAPALAMVLVLFVYPLGYSLVSAFTAKDGHPTLDNFTKTLDLYGSDIVFTVLIVAISTALTGMLAAAIGGYLVLGAHPAAVTMLRWLYRWPLFIPFIVGAQCMRTFLAKNGMSQPRAVGLCRAMVLPVQAAGDLGATLLGGGVPSDRRRHAVAWNQHFDRASDRARRSGALDPGRDHRASPRKAA